MTHNEKLSFVISKIHEAVPEIKELKFGCAIETSDGEDILIGYYEDDGEINYITKEWGKPYVGDIEIIGRKIGIADVLQTIPKTHNGWCDKTGRLSITPIATFGINDTKVAIKKGVIQSHKIASNWDLKNDDITKQSEETVDFLYNLLK